MSNLKQRTKQLGERWRAKSPIKNKRLTNFCVGLVSIAGIIVTLPVLGFVVPATLITYSTLTITIGGMVGVKSKLTFIKPEEDVKTID